MFYSPHALAGGNQRIHIREKMVEFSSAVLSTPSLYLACHNTLLIYQELKNKEIAIPTG